MNKRKNNNSPLKIAVLGHKTIPSRQGGIEIVVEELTVRMAKLGHKITVYNRSGHHVSGKEFDGKKLKEYKGIRMKYVPTIDKKGLAAMSASFFAAVAAAFGKYDVVHFHAEGPCAMLWLPKLFGKRCVATVHGLDHQRAKWGKLASTYIMLGEKCAVKFADEIIVLKVCVDSIKRNAGNHRVIILTDDNYKQYVDIPKWVEEKKNKGIISRTHYSDILRLSLLAQHGGMWIDSTFFCTGIGLQEYFKASLWSIKRPDYFHASIAAGYFANYSFACDQEHRWIFKVILDFLLEYWKENDIMTDYLFLDYLIVLVQKYDSQIAEEFKNIKSNNPECDELYKIMGEKFNENKWNELKKNTCLFKLSWKYQYPKEKDGIPTFYGMLVDNKLN